MKLGIYLYELWRTRFGIPASLLIAVVAALVSSYRVSLLPPSLHPRGLEMAAASTQVVVDSPLSQLLQPESATELSDMTQRTLILGNVIGSPAVVEYIAQIARIPASAIEVQTPTTPPQPEAIVTPENHPSTADLLRPNNEYRINVQANPTVPILSIYTEADSIATAKLLANAAVSGLRQYVQTVANTEGVGGAQRLRLDQLGGAEGGAVTGAVNTEVAGLAFLFTLVIACVLSVPVARVARGWKAARNAAKAMVPGSSAGASEPSPQREFDSSLSA